MTDFNKSKTYLNKNMLQEEWRVHRVQIIP